MKRIGVETVETYLGREIDRELYSVRRGIFQTDGGLGTKDFDKPENMKLVVIGQTSSKTYWGYEA